MSYEEMDDKFQHYGEDQGGYSKGSRGLFGQGLMQALFSHDRGNIISIKDKRVAKLEFKFVEKSGREPGKLKGKTYDLGHANKQWRDNLGIKTGDGTVVEFILNSECTLPQPDNVISKLQNFYMLRLINMDPSRKIIVEQIRGGSVINRSELKYRFPTGTVLAKDEFDINYESYPGVKCEFIILKHENALSQNSAGEDREGGLLVVDDKDAVYDLTFFDYESSPYIDKLFGIIKLTNVRQIIKDRLEKHNEAILTDSRDGFDRKHSFYKCLLQNISPYLKKVIEQEEADRKDNESVLSPEVQKRHQKAFSELNKIYHDLTGQTGEVNPEGMKDQPETMSFNMEKMSIKIGKPNILVLFINPLKVQEGQTIKLYSNPGEITIEPSITTISKADLTKKIVTKIFQVSAEDVGLCGEIGASTESELGSLSTNIQFIVVPLDFVIPQSGMIFSPKLSTTHPGRRGGANLFIDLKSIPSGSEITFATNNDNIILLNRKMVVADECRIPSSDVALLRVQYAGTGIGQKAIINASFREYSDDVEVHIVSKKASDPKNSGIFKEAKYTQIDREVQSMFEPESGIIHVNSKHPINQLHFGQTPSDFKIAVEKKVESQLLLAEILLNECLFTAVSKAFHQGKIVGQSSLDEATIIRNHTEKFKYTIGDKIHKWFITGSEIEKN
jgi:hypothetical protein